MRVMLAVSLLLGAAPPVLGQAAPLRLGTRVRVFSTTTDGKRIPPVDGVLEQVYPESVVVRTSRYGGERVPIPTNRDTQYYVHGGKKSSLLRGGLIGGTAGLAVGAAVYAVIGGRECENGRSVCVFAERTAVKGGLLFGAAGTVLGFAIGGFSEHNIWLPATRNGLLSLTSTPAGIGIAIRF